MITKHPIRKYDDQGNIIYSEDSRGNWYKKKYDNQGNEIYYEDYMGRWRHGFFNKITNNKEGIIIIRN